MFDPPCRTSKHGHAMVAVASNLAIVKQDLFVEASEADMPGRDSGIDRTRPLENDGQQRVATHTSLVEKN